MNSRQISERKDDHKNWIERDQAESRQLARLSSDDFSTPDEYRCTKCIKKFEKYKNMRRHRRSAHKPGGNPNEEEDISSANEASESGPQFTGWEAMDAQQKFFAQVSNNITINLQHYLQGTALQLKEGSKDILWRKILSSSETGSKNDNSAGLGVKPREIKLEEFNFPVGFQICESSVLSNVINETSANNIQEVSCTSTKPTADEANPTTFSVSVSIPQMSGTDENVNVLRLREVLRIPEVNSCSICHAVFANSASLAEHISTKHAAINESAINPTTSSPLTHGVKLNDSECIQSSTVKDKDLPLYLEKTNYYFPLNEKASVLVAVEPEIEQQLKKKYLCLVCVRDFDNQSDLCDHQRERHANIDCQHMEVDMDYSATWRQQPNSVGALNVSCCQLPAEPGNCFRNFHTIDYMFNLH